MVKVSEFPAVNSVVSRRRSGVRTKKPTPPREEERLRIWPQGVCPGGRLDMGLQWGGGGGKRGVLAPAWYTTQGSV